MDAATARAHSRHGVVSARDLGPGALRKAGSRGLVLVQSGAYVAGTQPVGVQEQLAALRVAFPDRGWHLTGRSALWWYGVLAPPTHLEVGVAVGARLAVRRPVVLHRVAPSVLLGRRTVRGVAVVALEVAVVQASERRPFAEVVELVELVVRSRRTTVARLRARCRRGFAGSAVVRAACDVLVGGSMDKAVRLLRAALERRGVRGLEVEVRFESAGGALAYGDLFCRGTNTLLELDGFLSHAARQRFRADRRRDRWLLSEQGTRTLRFDVQEVFDDVEAVADQALPFLLP